MAVKVPSLLHKMSPTYQKAWYKRNKMPLPAHLTGSVAQARKEVKPTERVKNLRAKSLKAYGATKGTRMGSDDGSGEALRDTTAPLTRDQHSKVQAAARAAKAATKAAAPAKPKKPLSQAERLAAIGRAVKKAKSKERFDVATMNPDDMDHDDLRDVHQSLHVGRTYSESVEQINEIGNTEKGVQRLRDYAASDRSKVKIKDVIAAKRSDNPEKALNKLGMRQQFRAKAQAKVRAADAAKNPKPKQEPKDWRDDVYPRRADGKPMYYHSDSVNLEGPLMNEVSKKEAEEMLGGPVKDKPKGPAGKHPLGYRLARNAARKAMKGAVGAVHKSMEKTMAKEEVEQIDEQDDTMQKKEMAQTQLHFIGYAAKEILEFIDMGGDIEEWYQNKLSKVQSEVESLHSYIEGEKRRTGMVKEEEQIDEKAPPGAKFERMVKHIKKGYAKGGLTPKEKSIAYATAWKAYGKKEEVETEETAEQVDEKYMGFKKVMAAAKAGGARNPAAVAAAIGRKKYGKEKFQAAAAAGKKMGEEVEVVAEGEGTVAVTPKEKALAAHHGDPKKITYGDVIKARLKSAAAKKMGK